MKKNDPAKAKAPRAKGTRKKVPADPAAEKARKIALAAFDKKGYGIVALDVKNLVDYADYFVIVSANTEQQVKAIWSNVEHEMKTAGFEPLNLEGHDHNRWVLVDYRDVMVHILLRPLRDLYDLERLWGDAPPLALDLPEADPIGEDLDF